MDNTVVREWATAPWWLDAVHEDDVSGVPDEFDSGVAAPPLSVALTLLAVELVGPGPEAIALLQSLAGLEMTGDQRLTVVQLWQPQLAWAAGAEQTAIVELAGPAPRTQAERDDDFEPLELAPALNVTVDHAEARIWQARMLAAEFKATGDALRSGRLDAYRVHLMVETLLTMTRRAGPAGGGADPAGRCDLDRVQAARGGPYGGPDVEHGDVREGADHPPGGVRHPG